MWDFGVHSVLIPLSTKIGGVIIVVIGIMVTYHYIAKQIYDMRHTIGYPH